MQKITTHLWFEKDAKKVAEFYVSIFADSKIKSSSQLNDTPSGTVDIVTIELAGREFMLLAAGPLFTFNPSVSFLVACRTKEEVDATWKKLIDGGMALMEIGSYPFSERYGWLQDKYGLSWQIMYMGDQTPKQSITPFVMFVGDVCGKAEEAMNFWMSIFSNSPGSTQNESKVLRIQRYGPPPEGGAQLDKEGSVQFATFSLGGNEFAAMDSAYEHKFAFNEAISFIVYCDDQKELDYFWGKLSASAEHEQCGWLKDKYGLSWQIVPVGMDELMQTKDKKKLARVTEVMLKMKKLDLGQLQKAYAED